MNDYGDGSGDEEGRVSRFGSDSEDSFAMPQMASRSKITQSSTALQLYRGQQNQIELVAGRFLWRQLMRK